VGDIHVESKKKSGGHRKKFLTQNSGNISDQPSSASAYPQVVRWWLVIRGRIFVDPALIITVIQRGRVDVVASLNLGV
jgi:hypothetical protein